MGISKNITCTELTYYFCYEFKTHLAASTVSSAIIFL